MTLMGVVISHLEHADDMVIMSRSATGLQTHLNMLSRWCSTNFLVVNALKSWLMVFGVLPRVVPLLTLGSRVIRYTAEHTYVGLTFRSSHRNIFWNHYVEKAKQARKCGHAIFGIESMIGKTNLPPKEGRILYCARVDPHLISGSEVAVDVDFPALQLLCDVQHKFLRRLLRVNSNSILAPLFTELAIMPLRFRRASLALRFLLYLINLPPSHYANLALRSSDLLMRGGNTCWLMDLHWLLLQLPTPVSLPPLHLITDAVVDAKIREVKSSGSRWLQSQVSGSRRLYLLHGRLEPLEEQPAQHITLCLRHYLTLVVIPVHRQAITRLILSDHPLACEQLRRQTRHHPAIPYHRRLCRFCALSVETPEHLLIQCVASPSLVQIRRSLYGDLAILGIPCPPPHATLLGRDALACLKGLIFNRISIRRVSRAVAELFELVEGVLILRLPPEEVEEVLEEDGDMVFT